MMEIGFFGLGLMGGNIVENLLKKNYQILTNKRGRASNIKNKFNILILVLNSDFLAALLTLALAACLTLFLACAVFANVIFSNNR